MTTKNHLVILWNSDMLDLLVLKVYIHETVLLDLISAVLKQHFFESCPYFHIFCCFLPILHVYCINLINSNSDCAKVMKSQTNFNQVTMSVIVITIQRDPKLSKQTLNGMHTPFCSLLIWKQFPIEHCSFFDLLRCFSNLLTILQRGLDLSLDVHITLRECSVSNDVVVVWCFCPQLVVNGLCNIQIMPASRYICSCCNDDTFMSLLVSRFNTVDKQEIYLVRRKQWLNWQSALKATYWMWHIQSHHH